MEFHPILNRISPILTIRYSSINLSLLSLSIFKEVSSNLWEQRVRQNVLVLLRPLSHLATQSIQFVRDQICRTAGKRFFIADTFLLNLMKLS